jgi:HK97 family phage major capsid protein
MPTLDFDTILEKKRERKRLYDAAVELRTSAENAGRKMTTEERQKYDSKFKDIERLSQEITDGERELNIRSGVGGEDLSYQGGSQAADVAGYRSYDVNNPPQGDSRLSLGRYLRGIITGRWDGAEAEQRANATSPDASGGYLIPEGLKETVIQKLIAQSSVLQAGTRIVEMPYGQAVIPRIGTNPTVSWFAENAEITAADMAFESVSLTAKKAACRVIVSNELLNDSPILGDTVERAMVQQIRQVVDDGFLNGTGSSDDPVGILNASGTQTKDLSDATISIDDLVNAYWALMAKTGGNIVALMNSDALAKLDTLKSDQSEYLTGQAPAAYQSMRKLLAGNIATATGSPDTTSIVLGDFKYAVMGLTTGMKMQIDPYSLSKNDQTVIRMTYRVDFALTQPSAFFVISNAGL